MPEAYKDVERVALVVHKVGIAKLVARLRPIAVTYVVYSYRGSDIGHGHESAMKQRS